MPRPPSIRLQAAKLLQKSLDRIQAVLDNDPTVELTEEQSRIVANLARADKYIRDRVTSEEEEKDLDAQGLKAEEHEKTARALVAEVRAASWGMGAKKPATEDEKA